MRPAALLVALLTLTACSSEPAFQPIPPQAPDVQASDPPAVPCFFSMTEPRADRAIVHGIPLGLGAGPQRWTADRAAVRCTLPSAGPWLAAMDLYAAEATLRDTGPITLSFTANGREIGRLRCANPGPAQFRAPLPSGLATAGAALILEVSIDKPWISPGDGAKLGVLVAAMGFLQP